MAHSYTAPGSKLMLTALPHMLSATGCLVAEVKGSTQVSRPTLKSSWRWNR